MYPRNKYWKPLVAFLNKNKLRNEKFIGPEVLLYEFPKLFPYQVLASINLADYDFEWIVFHKKIPEDLTNDYLDLIESKYKPVWGNHLFIVFKKNRSKKQHFKVLKNILDTNIDFSKYKKEESTRTGILITTYNRPDYLKKLLKQLETRKEEILIVNDGSSEHFVVAYNKIKEEFPKYVYIDNPKNMGLCFSLNTGFSYFLADPSVAWVHYIQDDVVLNDNFFEKLHKVADSKKYPVLTGIYRKPHPVIKKNVVNEVEIYFLMSAPAQHFMLHRQYLQDNLPIPTPYIGAPKRDKGKPGQGSDEDWWLISWSPNSIVKKGGYIVSIPNLCKTDMTKDSTWD